MRNKIAVLVLASAGAIAGITQWEGFRSDAYLDIGGVPTIGYGSTKDVELGDKIDENGARKRLISELISEYHPGINNCVKVPLNQSEYDAYLSLTYNIGIGAFCKSTLVKLLNQEKYTEACNELPKWNKVKGKVSKGLVNRRAAELKLCMSEQE